MGRVFTTILLIFILESPHDSSLNDDQWCKNANVLIFSKFLFFSEHPILGRHETISWMQKCSSDAPIQGVSANKLFQTLDCLRSIPLPIPWSIRMFKTLTCLTTKRDKSRLCHVTTKVQCCTVYVHCGVCGVYNTEKLYEQHPTTTAATSPRGQHQSTESRIPVSVTSVSIIHSAQSRSSVCHLMMSSPQADARLHLNQFA